MDIIDQASELNEFHSERALRDVLRNGRPSATARYLLIGGERCCLDCEEPLSAARQAALPHAARCVPCQAKKERLR